MKYAGRYIAAAILSIPTALFFSILINHFGDEVISRYQKVGYELFLACWVASSFSISLVSDGKYIRGYIAAVLLAFPTAMFISTVINYFIEQMFFPNHHFDYNAEDVALSACWAASSLWISRAATGRLVMSRGCGVFSMAAFALPLGIALTIIVAPPIQMEILTPLSLVLLSALIGVPLGLFSWGLAHVFRSQEMPNGNESRNWRG